MILENFFVALICALLSSNVIDGLTCPTDIDGCECFNTDQSDKKAATQVRCENDRVNSQNLQKLGLGLSGNWDFLYIYKTKLTQIDTKTFGNASFKNIFIEGNDELKNIKPDAFGVSVITEVLEIRDNKVLSDNGIFKIAENFGNTLKKVWFDKNNLSIIPPKTFVGEGLKFKDLAIINIDSQQGNVLTAIPELFVSNLSSLIQVSLGSNNISIIGDRAFDLVNSNGGTNSHVSIFLDKNNKLPETQITAKKIIIPNNAATSVGLNLEGTGITELTKDFADLISSIAKKADGRVYLKDISIAKCDCTSVGSLKDSDVGNNIHGIDVNTIQCSSKPLKDCSFTSSKLY